MESEMKKAVTKDMVIADVLRQYPDVAVIMLEHGLHCVGCHANVYDTIEAGCKVHGIDDTAVDSMVAEMNKFIGEVKSSEKDSRGEGVSLTDVAAGKIKELLVKEGQGDYGLRVSVMPGGCSGFVYQMNFEPKADPSDVVFEDKGVKVFVDPESLKLISGAEVDYMDSLNESGFKINNPRAKHGCGCGKSFG